MRVIQATAVALVIVTAAWADEPAKKATSIQVTGAVEKPAEWTTETVATQFAADVKEITFKTKDGTTKAKAVPLVKLVNHARPKIDEKKHRHELAFTVIVRGTDGYVAAFSMGELMAEYGNAEVYVALDRDGGPLPEQHQPMSLIVPSDKKGSRWVHGIATISVVDAMQK